jgi:predicted aconitase with swiveling domain
MSKNRGKSLIVSSQLLYNCHIHGKAPLDALISAEERLLILEAMAKGMDIAMTSPFITKQFIK